MMNDVATESEQSAEGAAGASGTRPEPPVLAFISPFTKRIVNPITRRFAGWLPGFALLIVTGRKTGKTYRVPLNAFRRGDSVAFALTYGSRVHWVQNALAAGGCEMQRLGRRYRLVDPKLSVDPSLRPLPLLVRWFLSPLGVTELLTLRIARGPDGR
jgi:deazaflavin-dependent oxidoreductase (nitroreductase family)